MLGTAAEIIKRLQTKYREDEYIAYTFYSEEDVEATNEYSAETIWNEIADGVDSSIDYCQSLINESIEDLVADFLDRADPEDKDEPEDNDEEPGDKDEEESL